MEKVGEIIYDRDSLLESLDRMKNLLELCINNEVDEDAKKSIFKAFNYNAEYVEATYDYLVSRLQHSETERFKL
ncbi:MAG: hypothetical protein KBT06_01240 [Prevotellaceae bacterium]|nr:hypothetical protein [Candidatus Colivivens equi]